MKKIITMCALITAMALALLGCNQQPPEKKKEKPAVTHSGKTYSIDNYKALYSAVRNGDAITLEFIPNKTMHGDKTYFKHTFEGAQIRVGKNSIIFTGSEIHQGYENNILFYHVYIYTVDEDGKVSIMSDDYDADLKHQTKSRHDHGVLGESVKASANR